MPPPLAEDEAALDDNALEDDTLDDAPPADEAELTSTLVASSEDPPAPTSAAPKKTSWLLHAVAIVPASPNEIATKRDLIGLE